MLHKYILRPERDWMSSMRLTPATRDTAMIMHLSANDFCNDYFMLYDTGISA